MKKTLLYLAGAGLLGYALYRYFTSQAQLLQQFTYKVIGFKVLKLQKNLIAFDVIIRFSNKSNVDAKVKRIFLDVNIEGENIGFIEDVKEFVIPAKADSDIPIRFTFNPQLVLKNIVNILIGVAEKKDLSVSFKGSASIQSGLITTTIPINYQTTIKEYTTLLK